jgi:hypothetical protein
MKILNYMIGDPVDGVNVCVPIIVTNSGFQLATLRGIRVLERELRKKTGDSILLEEFEKKFVEVLQSKGYEIPDYVTVDEEW